MNQKYAGFSRSTLKSSQSDDTGGPPPFEKLQTGAPSRRQQNRSFDPKATSKVSGPAVIEKGVGSVSSQSSGSRRVDLKASSSDDKGKPDSLTNKSEQKQPAPEARPKEVAESALYKIPTIKLNMEEFTTNLQNIMQDSKELDEDMSKALVALNPNAAYIPTPKLKDVSRLRTEHLVYELPDSHRLLEGLDKREPDDPSHYLLAIWTPGETANSSETPKKECPAQQSGQLCKQTTCFACNSVKEANSEVVRGTILIPCRTATRGSFPLNGTYFQVNEMFADHASSLNPINVPRAWIWNLPRRTVYFGTSVSTIFKGLSTEGIQYCFWKGFVCVRGFDRIKRAPRPLLARLHFAPSRLLAQKNKANK